MPFDSIVPGTRLDMESHPLGRVSIDGSGAKLRIGLNCQISAHIVIGAAATNTLIEIGDNCVLNGRIRVLGGDRGRIIIGEGTTFNAVDLTLREQGEIVVGCNNKLSSQIRTDLSDRSREPRREAAPTAIHTADDVWIGARVLLLNGAEVGKGSIIGAGSVVSGAVPANVLAMGTPARTVRENVAWRRDCEEPFDLPERAEDAARRRFMFWEREGRRLAS